MLCNQFPGGYTVLRQLAELGELDYISAGVGLYETTAFFLSITVESVDFVDAGTLSYTQPPKPFSIVSMQYSQQEV